MAFSLKRNSVCSGEFLKECSQRPAFASVCLFKSAAYASNGFEELLIVEELLVGVRALDYDLGLAVDGQDGRLSGFLELANQDLGISLEFAEGVNVCKVEGHTIRFT